MPLSEQIQPIIGLATSMVIMAGVAVMVRQIAHGVTAQEASHHSIPWQAKKPLIEKYGLWAVNRAEAFCPENDVACVEREARRMMEVMKYRR